MLRSIRDDDDEILRDGKCIHVPLFMRDGVINPILNPMQRAIAESQRDAWGTYPPGLGTKEGGACTIDGAPGHFVKQSDGTFLCVPDNEDSMNTADPNSPSVVCDALGRTDAFFLSQPGPRYLKAGSNTTDHARIVMSRHMAVHAYQDLVAEAASAWKGPTQDKPIVNDTKEAAYAAMCDELQSAWRGGR